MTTTTFKYALGMDIDGVLRDFCTQLLKVFKREYPEYADRPIIQNNWNLHKVFPIGEQIYDFCFHKHVDEIFSEAPPIPGALFELEHVKNILRKTSGRLIFITTQKPPSRAPTLKWLAKHVKPELLEHIIITDKKAETPATFLIDDNLNNVFQFEKANKTAFLIDRPWNQLPSHAQYHPVFRVPTISAAMELIVELVQLREEHHAREKEM